MDSTENNLFTIQLINSKKIAWPGKSSLEDK